MLMPGGWPGGGGWAPLELTYALYTDELEDELPFFAQVRPRRMIRL